MKAPEFFEQLQVGYNAWNPANLDWRRRFFSLRMYLGIAQDVCFKFAGHHKKKKQKKKVRDKILGIQENHDK